MSEPFGGSGIKECEDCGELCVLDENGLCKDCARNLK